MMADRFVAEQKLKEEYEQTIEFIKKLTKFGINLGLDRIRALLRRLGNPERELKVIHVGGTNGKGSTVAVLASILRSAGYRAGMFISPHLHDYRERISINGEMISREDVIKGIEEIKPHLEFLVEEGVEHPTEFEVSTALALLYFARKKPDFVLLEVGLGGEIDSTNVVQPLVAVLTSIGLDHMNYLGETIGEIARVKAGIIKEKAPVVTSADKPEALKVIEEKAAEKGVRLVRVGKDVYWDKVYVRRFNYYGLNNVFRNLELTLAGDHQFVNAATALAVCEILEEEYGFRIPEKAIRQGLRDVRWPGRLELISQNPKILLDGAHNVDGMKALAAALASNGIYKRKRLIFCLGMLEDKEIEKAVSLIASIADKIIVTRPDSPRAGNWEYAADIAGRYLGKENVLAVENPVRAVRKALAGLGPEDMLCVTGSLYMLAEVREYLLSSGLKNTDNDKESD